MAERLDALHLKTQLLDKEIERFQVHSRTETPRRFRNVKNTAHKFTSKKCVGSFEKGPHHPFLDTFVICLSALQLAWWQSIPWPLHFLTGMVIRIALKLRCVLGIYVIIFDNKISLQNVRTWRNILQKYPRMYTNIYAPLSKISFQILADISVWGYLYTLTIKSKAHTMMALGPSTTATISISLEIQYSNL